MTALIVPPPARRERAASDEGTSAAPDIAHVVAATTQRLTVRGKFLFSGEQKYWLKGVTYGGFRPDEHGHPFPPRARIDADFEQMAAAGINTVRVYTAPPRALLDLALRHGLLVMVGLAWEQHVAFLESRRQAHDIVQRVRETARACAGHAAVLGYAVGNEIPAAIVRWHGRRRIERFIARLYRAVKREDPAALVTYVNFPTTEYLQLPFLDFCCFNVYLESSDRFESYLARLQNLAGEKPLVMAEIGLDSRRHGLNTQALSVDSQVRASFAAGCSGAFVFGWTDEWHRGGHDITDWDFGLTTAQREFKPALAALTGAFNAVPFPMDTAWPRISVVVCTYNGARTLRDTLEGLKRVVYRDFEVIVVNDGSTDATPAIAREYEVSLITTENRGLSSARNTGFDNATGEIVAYIDDDAYPDPHWLQYLAHRFMTGDFVAVGGPNIAPHGDGPIADCVANAPGGPIHVLISDIEAEHIPGCNMAFRRDALAAIGGFDPRFRTAGDDVDVCWRLQARGGRIGFHAGAMDWHHRRNSVVAYWRQQKGYGRAESLLEDKWPERYNAAGHLAWTGRLYGRGYTPSITFGGPRVYGGVWGSAAYQSLYEPARVTFLSWPLMPEWYLVIGALAIATSLGLSWSPLFAAAPFLLLALCALLAQAMLAAKRAHFARPAGSNGERALRCVLPFVLHLLQPLARLLGRLDHGLTPWRRRGAAPAAVPVGYRATRWSAQWRAPEIFIAEIESGLRRRGAVVTRATEWQGFDLSVRGGLLGSVRMKVAVEEHGVSQQLVLLRAWPHVPARILVLMLALLVPAALALSDGAQIAGVVLGAMFVVLLWIALADCARATGCWLAASNEISNTTSAVRANR